MSDAELAGPAWLPIHLPLELSAELIHVIRVRLDLPVERWRQLAGSLSDDERERAARFRFDEPRQKFITCRATLRQLLGHCCGIAPSAVRLRYGEHGKPEINDEELDQTTSRIEFSVSHSGDWGLIALTIGTPVGVDLEEWNPAINALGLAKRFFAPSESEELRNLPPDKLLAGFYRGWTSKEAYLKATGRGLSLSLSSFCVVIDPDQPAALKSVVDQPHQASRWTTKSLDVAPNYSATVMAATPSCRVQYWQWPFA